MASSELAKLNCVINSASPANCQSKMEEAKGGVLFIDEAYSLGEGNYGKQAQEKLLAMMTEPEYSDNKMLIILAGYAEDIHAMLERNQGLKSRFGKTLMLPNWEAQHCLEYISHHASDAGFALDKAALPPLRSGFEQLVLVRDQGVLGTSAPTGDALLLEPGLPPLTLLGGLLCSGLLPERVDPRVDRFALREGPV